MTGGLVRWLPLLLLIGTDVLGYGIDDLFDAFEHGMEQTMEHHMDEGSLNGAGPDRGFHTMGQGFVLGRPVVVVHVGPSITDGFDQSDFPSFPLQDIFGVQPQRLSGHGDIMSRHPLFQDPFFQDPFSDFTGQGFFGGSPQSLHNDIFQQLDSMIKASGDQPSSGFHVQDQGDHFTLSASLPGFQMQSRGGESQEQPLSVEVIGPSLVVSGQQSHGGLLRRFQQSFKLPALADTNAIQATYSINDGGLAVDIPAKAGSTEERHADQNGTKMWSLISQDEGSQTTFTMSYGSDVGALPSMFEDFMQPSLLDAFFGIHQGRNEAPTGFLARPSIKRPSLSEVYQTTIKPTIDSSTDSAAPIPLQPPSQLTQKAPLVVQRKDAKPFWRLKRRTQEVDDSFIEIVIPEGVEVGKPRGKQVPYGNQGDELELPVSVDSSACEHVKGAASNEHILQCKIQSTTVKKVAIKVSNEL